MLVKEADRPAKNGRAKLVAQVGDHAEAGVVDQVSPKIIADRFEKRRSHQRERHNRPRVVKTRRHKVLQQNRSVAWKRKEEKTLARTVRI